MSSHRFTRDAFPRRSAERASAIITCMFFIAIGALMLGSVLTWANNHGRLEQRKNELYRAQYVAEAATEKAYGAIRDYVNSTSQSPSQNTCNGFATNELPTSADSAMFADYQIQDTNGAANKMTIRLVSASTSSPISSGTYSGLNALITPYRVTARAYSSGRPVQLTTGIQRDIEIQQIPIFQFAIFYGVDMEIENGPTMVINGKVHSNKNGYFAPNAGNSLTFNDTVTLGMSGSMSVMSGDTHKSAPYGPVTFASPYTEEVPPLNLPIGAADPHDIIEMPPSSGTDPISSDRMYNKAGLRVEVKNSSITVKNSNGNTVSAPSGGWIGSGCISTNKSFFNYRENKTITVTDIDIGKMKSKGKLPSNGVLYVADNRSGGSVQETAVRLVNGATLPSDGLTVATQNPIYLKGNYNTSGSPAAVFADAVNVLSGNWDDSKGSSGLSSREATATTVNAAFFSGNVPSTPGEYSGGVENFPRFLEDWSGITFTYVGSMVAMFASETAKGKWSDSSYSPPIRNWSFDTQFLDSTKLPPGTPSVRTIRRTTWTPTT